jgi:hypothetical protein
MEALPVYDCTDQSISRFSSEACLYIINEDCSVARTIEKSDVRTYNRSGHNYVRVGSELERGLLLGYICLRFRPVLLISSRADELKKFYPDVQVQKISSPTKLRSPEIFLQRSL